MAAEAGGADLRLPALPQPHLPLPAYADRRIELRLLTFDPPNSAADNCRQRLSRRSAEASWGWLV